MQKGNRDLGQSFAIHHGVALALDYLTLVPLPLVLVADEMGHVVELVWVEVGMGQLPVAVEMVLVHMQHVAVAASRTGLLVA